FAEDVMADDRAARTLRHAIDLGAGFLMLDLDVVADSVDDEVVFDQAGDERRAAIGITEIHSAAGAFDHAVSYHPVPGRTLGRDAVDLLVGVVALYQQIIERDVVGE